MSSRKASANKKQYTCEKVVEKYKEEYQRNLKFIKGEHDKYVVAEDIEIAKLKAEVALLEEDIKEDSVVERIGGINAKIEQINKRKTNAEYTTIAVMEAEKIWLVIRVAYVANENFPNMEDDKKIELITKDFKEFYNNFPIVSRYMICMGQYKQKAFKKFLKKCEEKLNQVPTERKKDYMQTQWIECQASYVKYLWEEMQQKRFSHKESQAVWKQAYDSLTREFKEFKENHEKVEEKIKLEDIKNKSALLAEAVKRVSNGTQKLNLEETRNLVNKLKDKKYKQARERVVVQIGEKVDRISPAVTGYGLNAEAQQEYEEELKKHECKTKYRKMDFTPQMF